MNKPIRKTYLKHTPTFSTYSNKTICTLQCELTFTNKFLKKSKINIKTDTINFIVQGEAYYNKDDVYDFKIGKSIALSRAKIKAYQKAYRIYNKMLDDLLTLESGLINVLSNNNAEILHEKEHIKNTLKKYL